MSFTKADIEQRLAKRPVASLTETQLIILVMKATLRHYDELPGSSEEFQAACGYLGYLNRDLNPSKAAKHNFGKQFDLTVTFGLNLYKKSSLQVAQIEEGWENSEQAKNVKSIIGIK